MGIEDLMELNREIYPEDEKRLWDEYWNATERDEVYMRIVELYLPLVLKVAKKLSFKINQKLNTEEFLSAGVVGLHGAVSSFDGKKDVTFSTFAYKRIYGAMMDELRERDPLTRTQRTRYKEICATMNKLSVELSRAPSDEELSAAMNMPIQEINRYMAYGSGTVALNQEFSDGLRYIDILSDDTSMSPVDEAHKKIALEKMRSCFRLLTEREQKILFLRHYEDMSVKEIAHVFDISEGRVSQIYQRIVVRMRALMESD